MRFCFSSSHARFLASALACLLALTPVSAHAAEVEADYQPGSQTLSLRLPPGVAPAVWELVSPPRLVVEVPGAPALERSHVYPRGFVRRVDVLDAGGRTQVIFSLARPLGGAWQARIEGDRLALTVLPRDGAASAPAPKASPGPAAPKGATPARANAVRVGAIAYDDRAGTLSVAVSRRVVPRFEQTDDPPRLIMDLPGTTIGATRVREYPGALVTRLLASQHTPSVGRVELTFSRPIGGRWTLKQEPGRLVLLFDKRAAAPAIAPPAAAAPGPRAESGLRLAGRVVHINTGAPLPNVEAALGGKVVRTDRAGRFSLDGVARGAHRLMIFAPGFAPQHHAVQLPGDQDLSFLLVPKLD